MEFGDEIVANCGKKDLALLLVIEAEELQDSNNDLRDATISGTQAADVGEFEIATQHVPDEPMPRLRAIRF